MKPILFVLISIVLLGCSSRDREAETNPAVVHVSNLSRKSACSGSLIAPNLVLTARHCVAPHKEDAHCTRGRFGDNVQPQFLRVAFTKHGASNLNLKDPTTYLGVAARMVLTPQAETASACGLDIAAIVLDRNVPNDVATPIKIRYTPAEAHHEGVQIVGFGITAEALRERTSSWGLIECLNIQCEHVLTMAEWQAGTYVCCGDSGGPALDSDGKLLGVAVAGIHPANDDQRCTERTIAVSAPYHADFIKESLDIASSL